MTTPTPLRDRHTRIVATIGPVSRDPETLHRLLDRGVDVCRINCSHSNAESIRSDVARIRRTASELGRSTGILLDLQGPKIRTGRIDPPLNLNRGDCLTVVMDAALEGRHGVALMLIAAGAKLERTNMLGRTAGVHACTFG